MAGNMTPVGNDGYRGKESLVRSLTQKFTDQQNVNVGDGKEVNYISSEKFSAICISFCHD
jgi:hypothetical protein